MVARESSTISKSWSCSPLLSPDKLVDKRKSVISLFSESTTFNVKLNDMGMTTATYYCHRLPLLPILLRIL
jgi:hypothetical protein